MPKRCPKCDRLIRDQAKTCPNCGLSLEPRELSFAEMFGPPKLLQGRYVIKRRLSQGRVGSVYQAVNKQESDRPCAVKELTTVALLDPRDRQEAERRFLERAAVWMSLNHPNLARVTDAFSQAKRLYLVMELVEGTSLRALLEDQWKVFSEQTVLHWAGQICDALDYLHRQDPPIVFGDLTPSHILVDPGGWLKLVDFGLTQLFMPTRAGSSRHTSPRGYVAPEQRRQGQASPHSDIYALGTILYQLLTRHDPADHPLPPLRKLAPDLSKSTEQAIIRARKKDPSQRFPSAAEMRQALLGERPAPLPEVEPFVLIEGVQSRTVNELARACAAHWDDGLMALAEGRITDWLRDTAEKLRATGQSHAALEMGAAAVHAESAREHVTSDDSITREGEIARQAAFAAWLEEMGAIDIQPSLEMRPNYLPFGTIEANMKARTTLRLRNQGQGYLTGRVESRVPWLTARPQTFGCRAGAVAEVTVEARGRRLPPGTTSSPQVLFIESNGGRAWVGASATAAAPILAVEPDRLDFGPVPRGAARVARLTVTNRGGGWLSGTVASQVPWLRVRNPQFGCPAGASAQIAVELLGPSVPPGTKPDYKSGVSSSQVGDSALRQAQDGALVVDSDSGQARVGVTWIWAEPSLELDVTALDFGAVERGASLERRLHITNRGTGVLEGRVTSQVDWLRVQPQALHCPPGESCTLNVVGDTVRLPGGDTYEESALMVETNAGREVLSASVEVLAAQLVIEPPLVDFGAVPAEEQVELTLTVGNRGSLPWQGQIMPGVPWLSVEPDELVCPPGHFIPVSVILDASLFAEGGEWLEEEAIQIQGDGEERAVAAHVAVLLPRLSLEPRSLDFGLIGREDVATLTLTIANAGTGELHWEVDNRGTWLEAVPTSGVCPPGQESAVTVNAYALAVGGETDRAWLTIGSNGGQAEVLASVSLSSPVLMVDALELDLGTSENYAPVAQWLGISNRGVGPLRGTITSQVPWLTVDPPAFECPTGASLQVRVQAIPEGLRPGANDAAGALLVESNGGNEEIGVHLDVVQVPNLVVHPASLTFKSDGPSELELVLENDGYGAVRVQVVSEASWLKVDRGKCTVKGGRAVRLKVRAEGAEPGAESVIEVRTNERTWRLPVRYE